MNNDLIDDLKQFIASTVSQTEERLQTQISQTEARLQTQISQTEERLQTQISHLQSDMANGFEGIGEAIEQVHQQAETQEVEADRRFTKLEQRIA